MQTSSHERRLDRRTNVDLFVNKYVDGYPYLCSALDISWSGIRLETAFGPELHREFYPIELGLPESDRAIWVWTRPVWTAKRQQALRFVGMDAPDSRTLARYLARRLEA